MKSTVDDTAEQTHNYNNEKDLEMRHSKGNNYKGTYP